MRRRSVLIAVSVSIIVAAALYADRSRPVVYALRESRDPVHEPVWSVLNPFRDRAPERPAETLLSHLQRGEYDIAAAEIKSSASTKADLVEQERTYPLRAWKLVDRRQGGGNVELFYRVTRGGKGGSDSPLWIDVR